MLSGGVGIAELNHAGDGSRTEQHAARQHHLLAVMRRSSAQSEQNLTETIDKDANYLTLDVPRVKLAKLLKVKACTVLSEELATRDRVWGRPQFQGCWPSSPAGVTLRSSEQASTEQLSPEQAGGSVDRCTFISYSSRDAALAERICRELESVGLPCWMAPRDITPGIDFSAAITDAISRSAVLLLLLSQSSNDSPQVVREITIAVEERKTIVPFRIEDVQLSRQMRYLLGPAHWLDASCPPLEPHLSKLILTVRMFTESPPWASGEHDGSARTASPSKSRQQAGRFLRLEISQSDTLFGVNYLYADWAVMVGKDRDNDVTLRVLPRSSQNNALSLRISRHHAVVRLNSERAIWENLACRNGTLVGLRSLEAHATCVLQPGITVSPAGVLPLTFDEFRDSAGTLSAIRLTYAPPGLAPQHHIVIRSAIQMGSHESCAIVVRDAHLSPQQFLVSVNRGSFWIETVQSGPVLLADGRPTPPGAQVQLQRGTILSCGPTLISIGDRRQEEQGRSAPDCA